MPIDLSRLDPDQRRAVTAPDGAVLVFAGAGSGKTRTLTARVAWLAQEGVPISDIMAVTFTRKAADEMRVRLARLLADPDGMNPIGGLRVGTFHAQMAAALRREARSHPESLAPTGRSERFTIWDKSDSMSAIGGLLRAIGITREQMKTSAVAAAISKWKNDDLDPLAVEERGLARSVETEAALEVWPAYADVARSNDAFDFDDLLTTPLALLRADEAMHRRWSGGIGHLLVDEFQDTNLVQLGLVESLSSVNGNLFVVGDDAQSIYRFRGARVENILDFRSRHPGSAEVTLGTNYRSSQAICDVANATLARSEVNVHKVLTAYGANAAGGKPVLRIFEDEVDEADLLLDELSQAERAGTPYSSMAVLVRRRAQTRPFEVAAIARHIPYRVIGGLSFFERAEVRDFMGWLRAVTNERDGMAMARALGAPRRGMGDKLISAVAEASQLNGGDWPAAMRQIGASKAGNAAGREALLRFAGLRDEWARSASRLNAGSLAAIVLEGSRLVESVNDGTDEGISRAENLAEVVNAASLYGVGELGRFIEAATLDAEMANRATGVSLTIATLHGAKGLEWSIVRLVGCEEGLLPNSRAETLDDYEEERRLFYVGVTRAKRNLVMSAVRMRTLDGHREQRTLSRFVREVRSDDLVDLQRIAPSARAARRNAPRQGQWR